MNIFATSPDPIESARVLDNSRVIKMILECAQLLSTAITQHGGTSPYKSTHHNHPCTIWTAASRENAQWVFQHMMALSEEYSARFSKTHRTTRLYSTMLYEGLSYIPSKGLQPFINCTTSHKHIQDVHAAYYCELLKKWYLDKRPPKWYREPGTDLVVRELFFINPEVLSGHYIEFGTLGINGTPKTHFYALYESFGHTPISQTEITPGVKFFLSAKDVIDYVYAHHPAQDTLIKYLVAVYI